MEKDSLFTTVKPSRALLTMAVPTIISQMILLLYNLADTWFIGRTGDPYMVAASSLGLTVYLTLAALANVFGVGGGSLMVRLAGEKKTEDAEKVSSYSVALSAGVSLAFSLLVLCFLTPLLKMLGAGENTLEYAKQYLFTSVVIGGVPTVLSMSMPQLLRNAGYSKEAGFGVGFGSLLNIALDPLFMFVLLPKGREVLGAGIATMLANMVSMLYFIIIFRKLRGKTVLRMPAKRIRLEKEQKRSLYSVGVPSAVAVFLYDLVTIVVNRLTVAYGDIPLAAMGIVLKLERIPINIGLGICLGMVPLIAYNFGAGDHERMQRFFSLARNALLALSCACAVLFRIFSGPLIGLFIDNEATVRQGAEFLRGRCFSLPFMMMGYLVVNYMNAVNKGRVSFLLSIIRHVVLIIPIMLIMNALFALTGLIWSQLTADLLSALAAYLIYRRVNSGIIGKEART